MQVADRTVSAAHKSGLIEEAIVEVAIERYDELRTDISCVKRRAKLIEDALCELTRLQEHPPVSPDYDKPWVALLYLTWYQPRQIYLASSIFSSFLKQSSDNDDANQDKLFIVDINGGCCATLFGMAMAYAIEDLTPNVKICMIEPSNEMTKLGKRMRFHLAKMEHGTTPKGKLFCRILRDSDIRYYSRLTYFRLLLKMPTTQTSTWFTLFHAVYKDNEKELTCNVSKLRRQCDRHRSQNVITVMTGKDRDLLEDVSDAQPKPFSGYEPDPLPTDKIKMPTDKIKRWRSDVADDHKNFLSDKAKTYLRNGVPGKPKGSCYVATRTSSLSG